MIEGLEEPCLFYYFSIERAQEEAQAEATSILIMPKGKVVTCSRGFSEVYIKLLIFL